MANEFVARKGLIVSGSTQLTGSLTVSNGITGSLFGTASWATNAVTASLLLGSVVSASFASTASFVNILNQNVSASGDIIAQSNLISRFSAGDEGGEINLSRPQTNTSLSGSVVIDVNGNRLRIFESNLPNRGGYWDITTLGTGVGTNLAGGAGTVTQVNTGDGLSGGPITGTGTIALNTASAHFITGSVGAMNLRGVVSSSTQINTGSFTGSFTGPHTGSTFGTASWANNSTSASFATTASFALNAGGSGFPYDGRTVPAVISGSLIISGSTSQGLFVTGSTTILGAFQATTKSFKIDHQTLLGKKLIYGVLEGPEHGVYVRGRLKNAHVITLPDEWEWLVNEESITVQLTAIGKTQQLYVSEIADNCVIIRNAVGTLDIDCFYFIQATRKDVAILETVE